ncbi:MAG: hypothetical protein AB1633_05740, partial [Elusimicrobiota bacterium]
MKTKSALESMTVKIMEEVQNEKPEVFVVGGFIRDRVLGRETTDIDFVVDKNTSAFAKKISQQICGRMVKLDEMNKIYRVIAGGYNLDFSQMQGKDIIQDLSRRDFTINAVAMKLESLSLLTASLRGSEATEAISFFNKIEARLRQDFGGRASPFFDPFGGLKDIKRKIIHSISEKNFVDDPLRLLRAFRFSAQLGFKIDRKTLSQIKKYSQKILSSSQERIHDELVKIFASERTFETIEEMEKNGLLEVIFPEVRIMRKSARKYYYHPKGLLQHSFETLKMAEEVIKNPGKFFRETKKKVRDYISGREWLIKFICLFHDVAKPQTV